MRLPTALCAASAAFFAFAAPAAALADAPTDYNLFALGNVNVRSGDIEGRVAAKGNASFQSYSIGNTASSNGVNLVVGGNLSAKWGSANGYAQVGGAVTLNGWDGSRTSGHVSTLPVDFTAAADFLTGRALELSAYKSNGTVASPYTNQWVLTGASSGLSVFNLSAAAISKSNTFTVNLTPGTKALINVSGAAGSLSGGLVINGGTASDILWNFYDASTLSFSSINMLGSVLAPNADYLGGWGQMHGTLIVRNFTDARGSTELHGDAPYTGDLLRPAPPPLPVPEPASWMLMIAGFGIVGAAMRHRQALVLARASR